MTIVNIITNIITILHLLFTAQMKELTYRHTFHYDYTLYDYMWQIN